MIILDKPQADLLRSFLVGHSKEIENSEHAKAMFEILVVLGGIRSASIPNLGKVRPDEGKVCDVILENIDLLTCFECGLQLVDIKENDETLRKDEFIGELCIDPGESNYPREPNVPAELYFVCVKCSHIRKEEK